ncbi:MAG: substrate-binding domain-containing protein [Niabella sp.]
MPLVFFDRACENYQAPKVITNDYECGRIAAQHLIEKGSKHPAFLSASASLSICNKRSAGFMEVLTEAGLNLADCQYLIDCNRSDNEITRQLQNLLQEHSQIDSIVASVEKIAIYTYLAALTQNLRIPQYLKVIAFSTLETASILNPSLTTISQPAFEIGKQAASILFDLIDKKRTAVHNEFILTLPSVLIERVSTSSN